MTDRFGHGISTRVARGGDHKVATSRSGRSPHAMSPRCQMVTIHRVTAPESEQPAPTTSPTLPSPATNFAATQHHSLATSLLDCDSLETKGHLACPNRRPAVKDS